MAITKLLYLLKVHWGIIVSNGLETRYAVHPFRQCRLCRENLVGKRTFFSNGGPYNEDEERRVGWMIAGAQALEESPGSTGYGGG
jgi:hypothetical protein